MQSTSELLVAAQGFTRLLSARQHWGCSLTLMNLPRLCAASLTPGGPHRLPKSASTRS